MAEANGIFCAFCCDDFLHKSAIACKGRFWVCLYKAAEKAIKSAG
jgi:hypothetical protein